MDEITIQFNPFTTFVDSGFWHKLTRIKLDIDKLEGQRRNIWGGYTFNTNVGNLFEINSTAFNSNPDIRNYDGLSYGILLNQNTIEEFKESDKTKLLNDEGYLLWQDIKNDNCIKNPSLLSRFVLLSFADLKKYQYYYWFAFPTTFYPCVKSMTKPQKISDVLKEDKISSLIESFKKLDIYQRSYFALEIKEDVKAIPLFDAVSEINKNGYNEEKFSFGFLDPSNNNTPGWVLRNFLTLLSYKCLSLHGKMIKIFAIRVGNNCDLKKSLLFSVNFLQEFDIKMEEKWIGWERNTKGNFGPKFTNMASSMDPIILAESSVDLNLKLMKWRLLPNLNLDILKQTKCLLLGAGTLGCSVARNLMAWGIINITLVDNGKISYSNPVRQSLFTHEDCLNGGRDKAIAAANNLRKIFPGVNSKGFNIHIPMPGHPVGESLKEMTEHSIKTLTELIMDSDVIFLLLDSREARWLPTLLGEHFNKIVVNAALGFDSFLIMRHGISEEDVQVTSMQAIENKIPGHHLGCYFCNDITSPGNSLKDRTLDQQCTVTRPGVANIAAALATEMAVAIIQHDQKLNAFAPYNCDGQIADDDESILGIIPHSIRGFLNNFQLILPSTKKFKQCVACSSVIIDHYKKKGMDFLMQVCDNAKYLEDITGLTDLHVEANNAEIWEFDDELEEEISKTSNIEE